jgi:hypothetical protein
VIKINAVARNREPEIVPAAAATMASSPRKSTCALAPTGSAVTTVYVELATASTVGDDIVSTTAAVVGVAITSATGA